MPKIKDKTFPAVRVTDKLFEETKMFAEDCEEYLSDYIRKAVEERNAKYRIEVDIGNRAIEYMAEQHKDELKALEEKDRKPAVADLKDKVKEMGGEPKVNTFFKK